MTAATRLRRSCSRIWRNAGVRVVGCTAWPLEVILGKEKQNIAFSHLFGGATSCLELVWDLTQLQAGCFC